MRNMDNLIDRPEPPRITKADALDRVARERGMAHGAVSALARLVDVQRQQVAQWAEDAGIPELYARRLKDVRPDWFRQDASATANSAS